MPVRTSEILNRVAIILQDTTKVRWPDDELLAWLNDGQREIALHKPNSCVKTIDHSLTSGTKQTLPADAISLGKVVRNSGGPAVRLVTRSVLDDQIPNWHDPRLASAQVKHYVYDEMNPTVFYVYPPASGGSVELFYFANPTDCSVGGNLSVADIYASVLVDYVLFRAYSKDVEYAVNPGFADAARARYLSALQGKAAAEAVTDPNNGNRFVKN